MRVEEIGGERGEQLKIEEVEGKLVKRERAR